MWSIPPLIFLTPSANPLQMSESLKETYERDGFVVVRGLVPVHQISSLEQASDRVINATRSGTWSHRRVIGKQFPPYGDTDPDSWGVQHIMHPDLHEPGFARWYTSDALVKIISTLLECDETDLQMGMWFRPGSP